MGNEMSIPTSVEAIAVYCAHCRTELGPSQEKHLYARVLCPTDSRHLAAVVKGSAGEFWLRVEAATLKWEMAYSPMCWFRGWVVSLGGEQVGIWGGHDSQRSWGCLCWHVIHRRG